jgi:hypothetical protein
MMMRSLLNSRSMIPPSSTQTDDKQITTRNDTKINNSTSQLKTSKSEDDFGEYYRSKGSDGGSGTDGVRNVTVTDRQTESNPFPLVFERNATMMTHDCKVVDHYPSQ